MACEGYREWRCRRGAMRGNLAHVRSFTPTPSLPRQGGGGIQSLDLGALAQGYDSGAFTPVDVAREVLAPIAAAGDDKGWISRVPAHPVGARAAALPGLEPAAPRRLPLYGVPFAVKDHIDVAGLPTTAACPAFPYTADPHAPCGQPRPA